MQAAATLQMLSPTIEATSGIQWLAFLIIVYYFGEKVNLACMPLVEIGVLRVFRGWVLGSAWLKIDMSFSSWLAYMRC